MRLERQIQDALDALKTFVLERVHEHQNDPHVLMGRGLIGAKQGHLQISLTSNDDGRLARMEINVKPIASASPTRRQIDHIARDPTTQEITAIEKEDVWRADPVAPFTMLIVHFNEVD